MSFWDVVWFIIITFAFTSYLMMLFSIVTDLFRDRETSGFAKALWLIALIFLPFLTALMYVVLRGRSMAERMERAQPAWRRQEAHPNGASGSTPADQIAQASAMLDKGTITQSEFEALKAKALV